MTIPHRVHTVSPRDGSVSNSLDPQLEQVGPAMDMMNRLIDWLIDWRESTDQHAHTHTHWSKNFLLIRVACVLTTLDTSLRMDEMRVCIQLWVILTPAHMWGRMRVHKSADRAPLSNLAMPDWHTHEFAHSLPSFLPPTHALSFPLFSIYRNKASFVRVCVLIWAQHLWRIPNLGQHTRSLSFCCAPSQHHHLHHFSQSTVFHSCACAVTCVVSSPRTRRTDESLTCRWWPSSGAFDCQWVCQCVLSSRFATAVLPHSISRSSID